MGAIQRSKVLKETLHFICRPFQISVFITHFLPDLPNETYGNHFVTAAICGLPSVPSPWVQNVCPAFGHSPTGLKISFHRALATWQCDKRWPTDSYFLAHIHHTVYELLILSLVISFMLVSNTTKSLHTLCTQHNKCNTS